MRLLQICTSFGVGGIQRHVLELSDSLDSRGHEVFLAGARGLWIEDRNPENYLPLDLFEVAVVPGHSKESDTLVSRILSALRSSRKLRDFLLGHEIQLIHAHDSAPAIVAWLASLGTGIPLVVTYHGSAPERERLFCRIARLTGSRIITPSQLCADSLRRYLGKSARVDVIGLGVRPPPSISHERIKTERARLLGSDGKLVVVTIARLFLQKGIDILVEVVRSVNAVRRDIRFVVVGDGPLMDEAIKWTTQSGVESVLLFEGETDEPYLYLRVADLFLLTSRWEGLPITIAEALQVGLPIVATDTGGVRELVSSSVGRVSPVADVKALSADVLEICGDDQLRQRMSAEALRISKEDRFSIPKVHEAFERLYTDILDSS